MIGNNLLVFLLSTLEYVYIAIAVLLVVLIAICLFFLFKKKKNPIRVNEEFIQTLIAALGSRENILSATNTNGRVHVEVEDLEKVNFEEIKKLSTSGVFVTNNSIKMLFSYDSNTICQAIVAKE